MKKIVAILIAITCSQLAQAIDNKMFEERLKFLAKRDKIISRNIANADTPGYRPLDLAANSKEPNIALMTTNKMHLAAGDDTAYNTFEAPISELKPNGNAVSIEEEMEKKAEISMQITETTNAYNKARAMMRVATVGAR